MSEFLYAVEGDFMLRTLHTTVSLSLSLSNYAVEGYFMLRTLHITVSLSLKYLEYNYETSPAESSEFFEITQE